MAASGRIDITSFVTQKKFAASAGQVQKSLADVLKSLFAATGADPRWIDVIDADGKKYDLKSFTEKIVNAQGLSDVSLLQKASKNTEIITKDILPLAQENRSLVQKDPNAKIVRLTIDLRKVATKSVDKTIPAGTGQVPQVVNNLKPGIDQARGSSTVGKNGTDVDIFKVNDGWLVKTAYELNNKQAPKNIGKA
jgi:hypothetical protein